MLFFFVFLVSIIIVLSLLKTSNRDKGLLRFFGFVSFASFVAMAVSLSSSDKGIEGEPKPIQPALTKAGARAIYGGSANANMGGRAPEPVSQDMYDLRRRAYSDDASTVEEALFHGAARAAVIANVQPNKLRVGGQRFRARRNPLPDRGAIVYDPRTSFGGVKRNLIWWVPSIEEARRNKAYPLNSPSKMVTPGLEFPMRAGFSSAPQASQINKIMFR